MTSPKKPKSKTKSSERDTEVNHVTLIETPFEIPTLEIADAQLNSEELVIDQDLVDDNLGEISLDQLQKAVETEMANAENEWAEAVSVEDEAQAVEDSEKLLAEQIAEDVAIEEENKRLAEAPDPEVEAAMPKPTESGDLDVEELQSCIEAILFVADRALSFNQLKELLGPQYDSKTFKKAFAAITEKYQALHHGIELVEVAGGYQFRTKPGRAALARKLGKVQYQKLSRGAMESLAIIAYKQPTLKDDIDKIRGVDSSHFIRTLLEKRLIEISGRSELPGRPMIYGTTKEFLELFGLRDLQALPPLREIEQMVPTSQTSEPVEDPKVIHLRKMVNQMHEESGRLHYNPSEDEEFLKDIKDRIKEIPTSTPTLDAQKDAEKAAKLAADAPAQGEIVVPADVPAETPPAEVIAAVELADAPSSEASTLSE